MLQYPLLHLVHLWMCSYLAWPLSWQNSDRRPPLPNRLINRRIVSRVGTPTDLKLLSPAQIKMKPFLWGAGDSQFLDSVVCAVRGHGCGLHNAEQPESDRGGAGGWQTGSGSLYPAVHDAQHHWQNGCWVPAREAASHTRHSQVWLSQHRFFLKVCPPHL